MQFTKSLWALFEAGYTTKDIKRILFDQDNNQHYDTRTTKGRGD